MRRSLMPTILFALVVLLAAPLSAADWTSRAPAAQAMAPATASETWQLTGTLQAGRAWATATLLADGRVLVTGGSPANWGASQTSAELYDPKTGAWTPTGSMNTARFVHSATLLADGRVLVSGGEGMGWLASAELYDPATGRWTRTGSMRQGRSMHTATLLPDGKVLVSGGYGAGDLTSAELYDPATGKWLTTGSMATPRMHHQAILLPDGKVLVCGGAVFGGGNYPPTASVEIYDPASGQWSATGSLRAARHDHQALLLSTGKVLAAGGMGPASAPELSAELYDPATGVWTQTGSLQEPHSRVGPLATLLPTGQVLIAGGYDSSGRPSALAEVYDPASGLWSATAPLRVGRYEHVAVALSDGGVLVAGGLPGVISAEVFRVGRQLLGDFSSGRPGSFFVLTGRGFPAGAPLGVRVNGRDLPFSGLVADATGTARFVISTATSQQPGLYVFSVTQQGVAQALATSDEANKVTIRLTTDGELRPDPGLSGVPAQALPADTTPIAIIYLPLTRK